MNENQDLDLPLFTMVAAICLGVWVFNHALNPPRDRTPPWLYSKEEKARWANFDAYMRRELEEYEL